VQQVDIVIIDDSRLQWPSVVIIVASSLWLADPGVTMSSLSLSMWTAVVHVIDARWAEALIFYVVVVCAGGTLL